MYVKYLLINIILFIHLIQVNIIAKTESALNPCAEKINLKKCIDHKKEAQEILTTIYVDSHMNLSNEDLITIQNTLEKCISCSALDQHQALPVVIEYLENKIVKILATINDYTEGSFFTAPYLYKLFVLNHQLEYLKQYYQLLDETIPQWQKYAHQLYDKLTIGKDYLIHYFGSATDSSQGLSLAQGLINYLEIEQDQIVLNYYNLARFIFAQQQKALPQIIRFWTDPQLYQQLALRAKLLNHRVIIQMEEIAIVASQAVLMAGSGLYSQWISQDDADMFQELTKQQNQLAADFAAFINKLQANQKEIATSIINGFKQAQVDLEKKYQNADKNEQQEIQYLFEAINLDKPRINYLLQPAVSYDQIFQASVMNTPHSNQWYNVYQMGNWQFDSSTNSFWQYQLAPFGTPFWKPFNGQDDPSRNAIFTEYVSPNGSTYDIEIECTLVQLSYPFFAGIMFNRGRWIAGDPERIWQYRLIGLYGVQSDTKDPATQEIGIHFAQQILQIPKTKDQKEIILSPLEQIATNSVTKLHQLDKSDVTLLIKKPLTYVFSINTSPDTVELTLSKKETTGSTKLFSTTLQGLDKYLTIFHGIGFMSSGCKTQFIVKKPAALIYSNEDISTVQTNKVALNTMRVKKEGAHLAQQNSLARKKRSEKTELVAQTKKLKNSSNKSHAQLIVASETSSLKLNKNDRVEKKIMRVLQ